MRERVLILKQSGGYVYLTRHLGFIFFFSFLVMCFVAIVGQTDLGYVNRFFHIAIVFVFVGFCADRFFRRVAYKIVINYERSIIEFYMCRATEIKTYHFREIDRLRTKNYLTFYFEREKILYNLAHDDSYDLNLASLKELSEIVRSNKTVS